MVIIFVLNRVKRRVKEGMDRLVRAGLWQWVCLYVWGACPAQAAASRKRINCSDGTLFAVLLAALPVCQAAAQVHALIGVQLEEHRNSRWAAHMASLLES